MSTLAVPTPDLEDIYPETDGKPIAENTLQFEWIVKIKGGLDVLFADDLNVFVAGDLFWYPVQGRPDVVAAPDAMVVFGRPKGFRKSYKQWAEGGIGPQVVFEVLSPRNRFGELVKKFEFYRHHGVDEYYIYNPGPLGDSLSAYVRQGGELVEADTARGFVSPRLGVRFEVSDLDDLRIIRPDGQPFIGFQELHEQEEQARRRADQEQQRADEQWQRADRERQRAEEERQRADQEHQRAEQERRRAEQAVRELEQLRERLRSSGQDAG